MTQPSTLTGQDIAEAQGAVTKVLDKALASAGATRHEYIVLRVLVFRGPFGSPKELHDFLAGQPQLALSPEAIAELLAGLEARDLAVGTSAAGPGPAEATPAGAAFLSGLTEQTAPVTRELFSGFDPSDLAVAHRVLTGLTERANQMTARP
jgi:hypothetical protein